MKYFALILSLYILTLSAVPVIQIAHSKLTAKCHDSFSKESKPAKENDGCEKRGCSLVTCCYNSLLLFISDMKYSFRQPFRVKVENNFNPNQILYSFNLFDIWHPPRSV